MSRGGTSQTAPQSAHQQRGPHFWRDNYQQVLNLHRLVHIAALDRDKLSQLLSGGGGGGASGSSGGGGGPYGSNAGAGSSQQLLAKDLLDHMNRWHRWVTYWKLTFQPLVGTSTPLEDLLYYLPPELVPGAASAESSVISHRRLSLRQLDKIKARSFRTPFPNLHLLHGILRWTKVLLSLGLAFCHVATAMDNVLLRKEQELRTDSDRFTGGLVVAMQSSTTPVAASTNLTVGGSSSSAKRDLRVISWHNLLESLCLEVSAIFPVFLQEEVGILRAALAKVRSMASLCTRATGLLEHISRKQLIHDAHRALAEVQKNYNQETFRLPPEVHDPLNSFDVVTSIVDEGVGGEQLKAGGEEDPAVEEAGATSAPLEPGSVQGGGGAPRQQKEQQQQRKHQKHSMEGLEFNSSTFGSLVATKDPLSFCSILRFLLASKGLLIHHQQPTTTATANSTGKPQQGSAAPDDVTGDPTEAMGLLSTPRSGLNPRTVPIHSLLESATSTVVHLLYEAVERYPNNAVGSFGMIPFVNDILHFMTIFKFPFPYATPNSLPSKVTGGGDDATARGDLQHHEAALYTGAQGYSAEFAFLVPPPQPNKLKETSPHNLLHLLPKISIFLSIAIEKLASSIEERIEEAFVSYQANKKDENSAATAATSSLDVGADGNNVPSKNNSISKTMSSAMLNVLCSIAEPIVTVLWKMDCGNPLLCETLLKKVVSSAILGLEGAVMRGGEHPPSAGFGLLPGLGLEEIDPSRKGVDGINGRTAPMTRLGGGKGKRGEGGGPLTGQATEDLKAFRRFLSNHPRIPEWQRQELLNLPHWIPWSM